MGLLNLSFSNFSNLFTSKEQEEETEDRQLIHFEPMFNKIKQDLSEQYENKNLDIQVKCQKYLRQVHGYELDVCNVMYLLASEICEVMNSEDSISFNIANFEAEKTFCKSHKIATGGNYIKISIRGSNSIIEDTNGYKIISEEEVERMDHVNHLDLSWAFTTVRKHQGLITLYTENSKLTVINIYLKASNNEASKTLSDLDKDRETNSFKDIYKDMKILVIDDDIVMHKLLKGLLKPTGAKIFSAYDGEEGLDVYRSMAKDVSLVIVDMIMPKLDGAHVFQILKKMNPYLKIIVASSDLNNKDLRFMKKCEHALALEKPYSEYSIIDAIKQLNTKPEPKKPFRLFY